MIRFFGIVIISMISSSMVVFAQDVAPAPSILQAILTLVLDNALTITLVVILISAVISAFIKQRSLDRCLRDFERYETTVKLKDGKVIWGTLRLFANGLELLYRQPHYNPVNQVAKYSYFITQNELDTNLQVIHRYHWELTKKNKKKRERSIRRTYKPSIFQRSKRGVINAINTLKDSFNRAISVFLGQLGKKVGGTIATDELSKFGTDLLGSMARAYNPFLEKYIGGKVVVELVEDDVKQEYEGILKEYSTKYLEILNIQDDFFFEIAWEQMGEIDAFSKIILIKKDGKRIEIDNATPIDVELVCVKGKKHDENPMEHSIHHVIDPSENYELDCSPFLDWKGLRFVFKTVRVLDLIGPHELITVRHAGAKEKLTISEVLGLDEITMLFIHDKTHIPKRR